MGHVFHSGVELWSGVSDGHAIHFAMEVHLAKGDKLDFAMDPEGAAVFTRGNPGSLSLINDAFDRP